MSNARIMLQATGEQDSFLTTGAKHTLFKEYHRRHALFGLDWNIINLNYNNTTPAGGFITAGSKHYFRIDNNGDLINEIYLRIKIKKHNAWDSIKYETIFKILDSVEFMCNDKLISKFTSDYMFSYFELNYTESDKRNLVDMTSYAKVSDNGDGTSEEHVYLTIPIPLWFHKNPGSAFPMWALNNPNIGINVSIKNYTGGGEINDIEILTNFSQISSDEKLQFANKPLEYLIETPEYVNNLTIKSAETTKKISILKTHFIKYFFWNIKTGDNMFTFRDELTTASLLVDGNPIVDNAPGSFFNQLNRYAHFNSGSTLSTSSGSVDENKLNPIYTYSFALTPTVPKLSGFVTSEKFNNVSLEFNIKTGGSGTRELNIYLVKHNVIRINDGHLNILYN